MGRPLPTQVAALLGFALLAPACSPDETAAAPGPTRTFQRQPKAPGGPAHDVVKKLLETCHGPLRGKDKMAVALLRVGMTDDDALPEYVILWTENHMRVRRRNGQVDVRLADGAWRATPDGGCSKLDPAHTKRLDDYQRLLRATLLSPLYEAEKVRHQGGEVYQLILPGGETWRLELAQFDPKEADSVFLPKSLRGPVGEITWNDYLHTGITHLPKCVELGALGERFISLERSDFFVERSWFTDPLNPDNEDPAKPAKITVNSASNEILSGGRPRSGKPWVGTVAASRSLLSPDPGTWKTRADQAWKNGRQLAGQMGADLEFYFNEGGKRWMAQPFVMSDEEGRGRPFVAKKGQRILRLPEQRVAMIQTKAKTIDEALETANKALETFLQRRKLTAAGPLRFRPYVMLEEIYKGREPPRKVEIRFELPVR